MEQGWDPDVKKYFRKVMYSFTYGLLWLASCTTAGIYYRLAYRNGRPFVYTVLFYAGLILSLALLLRWLYRTWRNQ